MSTFDGFIREFPGVKVDKFSGHFEAAFLSHCHTDHMAGLETYSGSVYCSNITAKILQTLQSPSGIGLKYPTVIPLPNSFGVPFSVILKMGVIHVTLIDSNHCPGSCMFLFESDAKRVLYTGDLRAERWFMDGLKTHPALVNADGRMKVLDRVYLDTTFATPTFNTLPERKDSAAQLYPLIRRILKESGRVCYLKFICFGVEALWSLICKEFDTKIYVDERLYSIYSSFEHEEDATVESVPPDLVSFLTTNPNESRIHVKWSPVCEQAKLKGTLICVIPSTMYWGTCDHSHDSILAFMEYQTLHYGHEYYRLLYSMHSSLQELKSFVALFGDPSVYPCVDVVGMVFPRISIHDLPPIEVLESRFSYQSCTTNDYQTTDRESDNDSDVSSVETVLPLESHELTVPPSHELEKEHVSDSELETPPRKRVSLSNIQNCKDNPIRLFSCTHNEFNGI